MRSGTCPKCESKEVYVTSGDGSDATTGIHAGEGVLLMTIKGKDKTVFPLQAYACAKCGHVEFYARDIIHLPKLRDATNWKKVG